MKHPLSLGPADGAGMRAASSSLPTLSVVVATRDRPELLTQCLASVRAGARAPLEIIVVDSASRDRAASSEVAGRFGARFLWTDMPGASHARNVGAAAAAGEVVAFTDDDATADSQWVQALLEGFRDPLVDVVVGPVLELGSVVPTAMPVKAGIDPASQRCRFARDEPGWFGRLGMGSIGYGANLAVRKSAFARFGTFRECLGAGAPVPGDELYFFYATVIGGGVVLNEPSAKVWHPPQTPQRQRDLQEGALAYFVYVLLAQPGQWLRVLTYLLRRRLARASEMPLATAVTAELASERLPRWRAATAVPRLLLAAWRVQRRFEGVAARLRQQDTGFGG